MAREFKLPDVGEGVAEGELVRWLVSEGDTVGEDQPVAEVETDKAQVEVPAPVNGTVRTLHWDEGDVVPVGDLFVTFDVEGEAPEPESEDAGDDAEATDEAASATSEASGRTFAPPSVRKLARELDVDLDTVEGTGPSGRVTEGDVRAAAEDGDDGAAAEPATESQSATKRVSDDEPASAGGAAAGGQEPAGRETTLAAPATRGVARELGVDIDDVPAVEQRDGEAFVTAEAVQAYAEGGQAAQGDAAAGGASREFVEGGETTEPYRGIRRTIGEQMAESKYTAPHVTHHDTAVIDSLVETRSKLKARAEAEDVKLTYMPFVMKAVVAALKEFPVLNSELREEDEEIALKQDYNIGVAVATDAGLMVPVVKHVDQKSMLEISEEMNELVEKARDRSISREEMQGGTFTITNFGAIGGEYATPIINYPETAILGLGAIDKRPVAEDGDVRAAETMPLSLSIDHRVIDGAEAAQFTNRVMEYLTDPELLLLE
ncbi:dihydrolipoamide acetyltransferase family protein [Halobacterium jilantaiense]|uniref:Pyruvate dehydrogenase E2 component (Dihydrolipoamide acetyltransferase) n=1 Tax=Halobacterium jilantaiense TaxID=355548 RepID=A0A1I0PWR3_9EURY|nr:dihydrolipoamide acetyltransferase family protein [Halobacterium jilantaiense]SEW18853.1 pyruvate dehydrogenase E2 component (dihydrolipoamide acetyltransferase) [Halobacterium jilantaiense]